MGFLCHESNMTKYCNMTVQMLQYESSVTTGFVFACLICNPLGSNSLEELTYDFSCYQQYP